MAVVSASPSAMDTEVVALYYAKDTLVGNLPVVVFHGPSTTTNSTQNSSRIQAHVFSIGGYKSFPRLTISPTSPLYATVHSLPEDRQGDEICRGLAFSLFKYYAEMPSMVKRCLTDLVAISRPDGTAPPIFDEAHAASLASKMVKAENPSEVASHIQMALSAQTLSWADLDVILPPGCIRKSDSLDDLSAPERQSGCFRGENSDLTYGQFTEVIDIFGSPSFLPTSTMRRAPSRPTAVSKTRILAEEHKDSLKRDMNEFLETEKNFVMRIYSLSNSPVAAFSQEVKENQTLDFSSDDQAVCRLLPESLAHIFQVNTDFLDAIRLLLDDTDESVGAESGIKMDNKIHFVTERDPLKVDAFARILLQFVPRFREPYQNYLRASAQFSTILADAMRVTSSRFAEAIRQTGEQRLKSWLIEPAQRLPRYSLFIESMVNQLPATHPAMAKFLKCKDMLADICALDNDLTIETKMTIAKLKQMVSNWPESLNPSGRLTGTVDAVELNAPYKPTPSSDDGLPSMLLLFPSHVLVFKKLTSEALSARGVLAEIDRPLSESTNVAHASDILQQPLFSLMHSFSLEESRFAESHNGRLLSIACIRKISRAEKDLGSSKNYATTTRTYRLLGPYEGKAGRWSEEVARARIEHRFPEQMRNAAHWGLRLLAAPADGIGLITAIFEDDSAAGSGSRRKLPGRIQVHLQQKGSESSSSNKLSRGVEIEAKVTVLGSHRYRLDIKALNDFESTDLLEIGDFAAVLNQKLSNLHRLHQLPITLELAQSHVSYNQKIVETLRPRFPLQRSLSRGRLRPYSPVKALTSFLGSNFREQTSPTKQQTFSIGDSSEEACNWEVTKSLRPTSDPSLQGSGDALKSKVKVVDTPEAPAMGSLMQLETTFNSYIVAMHSRCGNIVGKILRARKTADELKVNELYNTLIEDPSRHQAAAEVSIDVLFASFEKFLGYEWKERIGPVLSEPLLKKMQTLFDTTLPAQLRDPFKTLLFEMAPQNRRALSASIRLLFDLLDASGNDGDRGALTAAFTEALVDAKDAHEYMSLLDRMVEDVDVLFRDAEPVEVVMAGLPSGSLRCAPSVKTGSVSSTGSSLRKRFGFGILTRENSKSESESKVGQVWRTLSKKASNEKNGQPSSLSKGALSRSRSTDNESRRPLPSRPMSRDRPDSSNCENQQSVFGQAASPELVTPLAVENHLPPQRRKRRSSLSDLKDIQNREQSSFVRPADSRNHGMVEVPKRNYQIARKTLGNPRLERPQSYLEPAKRAPSPSRKENVAPLEPDSELMRKSNERTVEGVSITSLSPRKRESVHSGTRTIKNGLQERVNNYDPQSMPSHLPRTSPQKLKIQSPQKIRERLEREKKAMQEMTPGLQADLAEVREGLALLNKGHGASTTKNMNKDIALIEQKLTESLEEIGRRTDSIQTDLESSLAVSEKKCKSLDELYRESNAENELLYEKFNSELAKVLTKVKRDEGTGTLQGKLQEAQDEAARLRKENQRLKREVLGLRSQLTE